jgi:hypothetical protein
VLRVKPSSPAAMNGTGASVAIIALLVPTRRLLRNPRQTSALSLIRPAVAHFRSSPSAPLAQAAHPPEPRTTSRIPMVCMSSVSVPESGLKNLLGARSMTAPTPTRAAATHGNSEDDGLVLSLVIVEP